MDCDLLIKFEATNIDSVEVFSLHLDCEVKEFVAEFLVFFI